MKLNRCHIISSRDGHFFGNRVINAWNFLSDHIVRLLLRLLNCQT